MECIHEIQGLGEQWAISKGFLTHIWNIAKVRFGIIIILITQSGLKCAHTMTAQSSWHVQNHYLIESFLSHNNMNNIDSMPDSY